MAIDLATIVRQLRAVEARHPDAARELAPVIQALSTSEPAVIDPATTCRLLGLTPLTVTRWLEVNILPGQRDETTGEWSILLAEVLRLQAEQETLAAAGGEDLTDDELAALSATQPSALPWRRATGGQ